MQILETKEVKKYYQTPSGIVRALDGVSLSVAEGTFGAIVGSSGSGKTTLLHMLGGLDEPTDGEVWVRGTSLKEMSGEEKTVFRRRNIGFVFQNYNLVSTLSVRENITLPLLLDGMKVDRKFLKKITESLKLTEKLDHMPHMLSGGQQPKVAIARALITKPAVILADEPTGNLDSVTGMEVIGLLKTSAERFYQTILVVTHNEEIAQMVERIIRIEDGKVTVIRMKNNNQKILRLLAKREYQENKRRNRILIGTVAFAVWMIFCVFSLAIGKVQADYLLMVRNGGTKASTILENPSEEQYRKIQKLAYIRSAGMETDFAATDAFLCTVLDKTAWEKMQKPAYTDIHGEYPAKEDEIMLPMRALKLLGISKPKIGMTIPVTMTDSEGEEHSGDFRLSGYYTEYVDPLMGKAYGYFSQKYLDQLNPGEVSRTLLIEQSRSVDGQTVEDRLYQDIPMRDDSQQFFGGTGLDLEAVTEVVGGYDIAAVMAVVILLAAWLLIYNVLHISYGKDIRRFGLLKTLGTTGKQIRSVAYRQIRKILVLGCFWGSVAGVGFTLTVIPALLSRMYLHGLGKASAMIAFRPWVLAASVCFGILVTFLGAAGVVRKIGKLSPVESMKYMEKVSDGRKSQRQGKDPLKAMAWRNLFRFRKRCVLTIVSLTLGICVALSAVVITKGTDMTNQIEAENHDFKIMTGMSSGTISQYPTEETYFPEDLIEKMTGLDGVETVSKVTGGYGKIQLDEKILDLRRETMEGSSIPEVDTENTEETAPKLYEFVAEQVSDDYLEELKTLNEEKNLGLDLESVEVGTGAIMLHYNLFSRIEAQKGREDVGETFSTYTVQGEKTADMKFCGYLNFKEKGLPALDITWNGPGIVYFLVSEKEWSGCSCRYRLLCWRWM